MDDEIDFLDVMAFRMRSRGIEVTTAESASKALSILKKKTFDTIVMDFQMPNMDGITALKIIKAKNPEIQIIMLTAYATGDKTAEAINAGASHFLEKPADLDVIVNLIQK